VPLFTGEQLFIDSAGQSHSAEARWIRLNQTLNKLAIQPIELTTSTEGDYAGPMQESVLKTIYLLVQQVQSAKKSVKNVQFDNKAELMQER